MPTPEDRIARIETTVYKILDEQLDMGSRLGHIEGVLNGRFQLCQYEQERIDRVEGAVGKQNFIAAIISALVAGVTAAIFWVTNGK
jgi:hypothetical protein